MASSKKLILFFRSPRLNQRISPFKKASLDLLAASAVTKPGGGVACEFAEREVTGKVAKILRATASATSDSTRRKFESSRVKESEPACASSRVSISRISMRI